MPARKTVRIYDLAKELKQDTKRVMEELRRAGADVSVASNSVPIEFAEKLRSKYVAKADAPAKPRAIKVIKAAKKEDTPTVDEPVEPIETEVAGPEPEPLIHAEPAPVEISEPAPEVKKTTKILKPRAMPVPEPTSTVREEVAPEPAVETPAQDDTPTPEPLTVPEPPA